MLMSASDLALMKGGAAMQPGDGPELALVRAAEWLCVAGCAPQRVHSGLHAGLCLSGSP